MKVQLKVSAETLERIRTSKARHAALLATMTPAAKLKRLEDAEARADAAAVAAAERGSDWEEAAKQAAARRQRVIAKLAPAKLKRLEDAAARADDDAVAATDRGDWEAWKKADARRQGLIAKIAALPKQAGTPDGDPEIG